MDVPSILSGNLAPSLVAFLYPAPRLLTRLLTRARGLNTAVAHHFIAKQ